MNLVSFIAILVILL